MATIRSGRKMVVDTVTSEEKGSADPHETVVPARKNKQKTERTARSGDAAPTGPEDFPYRFDTGARGSIVQD
jgi:hypothetical protein